MDQVVKLGCVIKQGRRVHLTRFFRTNIWEDSGQLPESLAFYSACDVEPLPYLYQQFKSIIKPDYDLVR